MSSFTKINDLIPEQIHYESMRDMLVTLRGLEWPTLSSEDLLLIAESLENFRRTFLTERGIDVNDTMPELSIQGDEIFIHRTIMEAINLLKRNAPLNHFAAEEGVKTEELVKLMKQGVGLDAVAAQWQVAVKDARRDAASYEAYVQFNPTRSASRKLFPSSCILNAMYALQTGQEKGLREEEIRALMRNWRNEEQMRFQKILDQFIDAEAKTCINFRNNTGRSLSETFPNTVLLKRLFDSKFLDTLSFFGRSNSDEISLSQFIKDRLKPSLADPLSSLRLMIAVMGEV